MTTIVTRAGKGSALTWTEGDANITNLNNDKIENIVEDTTPQLGGNLDVNGNSIVSTSNGDINLTPNGTGKVVTTKTLNAAILASTQSSGDEGGQIELALAATNNSLSGSVAIDINQSQLRIFETGGSNRGAYINLTEAATGVGTNLLSGSGLTDIVQDTTPQLGGNLDVQANIITTSTTNGNITITPDGTGDVILSTDSVQIGESTDQGVLTTSGGNLRLNTNNGTNSGHITITAGANGAISISPNGTGKTTIYNLAFTESPIYDLGTTGGTISPNIGLNGQIQKITLNSALTMNGFSAPAAGQSLTLIIYGGTSYTSITSTMKFAGGIKTLTGTAGCVDILTVYYDGTNYWASLGKGFA